MIDTGDLRKGLTVEIDGTLYNIVDWEHNKTGRGGAKVKLKLRDVRAGHIIEQTYDSGAKFQRARVERVTYTPTWVRHPDFTILRAARHSPSWRRTVAVVGRGRCVRPATRQGRSRRIAE